MQFNWKNPLSFFPLPLVIDLSIRNSEYIRFHFRKQLFQKPGSWRSSVRVHFRPCLMEDLLISLARSIPCWLVALGLKCLSCFWQQWNFQFGNGLQNEVAFFWEGSLYIFSPFSFFGRMEHFHNAEITMLVMCFSLLHLNNFVSILMVTKNRLLEICNFVDHFIDDLFNAL